MLAEGAIVALERGRDVGVYLAFLCFQAISFPQDGNNNDCLVTVMFFRWLLHACCDSNQRLEPLL